MAVIGSKKKKRGTNRMTVAVAGVGVGVTVKAVTETIRWRLCYKRERERRILRAVLIDIGPADGGKVEGRTRDLDTVHIHSCEPFIQMVCNKRRDRGTHSMSFEKIFTWVYY